MVTWEIYAKPQNNSDAFITRYYHFLRFQTILKYLQDNSKSAGFKRCLDVGCGSGFISNIIADLGISVDAIDNRPNLCNPFSRPDIHYYNIDIENFQTDQLYDLIIFSEVFEHILPESRKLVLVKIRSLLNENGVLIFTAPNCNSFLYGAGYLKEKIINYFTGNTNWNWHYHIPITVYKNALESAGFSVQQWQTNGIFPVISNRIEHVLPGYVGNLIEIDKHVSKSFRGFGANYYCLACAHQETKFPGVRR